MGIVAFGVRGAGGNIIMDKGKIKGLGYVEGDRSLATPS